MRTLFKCHCGETHQSENSFMRCCRPKAAFVQGDGTYAVLTDCRFETVSLFEKVAQALQKLELINATSCTDGCSGRHDIVRVKPWGRS